MDKTFKRPVNHDIYRNEEMMMMMIDLEHKAHCAGRIAFTRTHAHTNTHTHTYIHTYTHTHARTHTHTHTHAHTHTHTDARECVCVRA